MTDEISTKIALFKGREIRKTFYHEEWWFVVEDVVLALIDSSDPKQYIQRMKLRDPELFKGWVQIVHTLEISKATFGVTPSEYKKLKSLKRENLRDHMDDFELIFNMLGERATTEIHRTENSKGIVKLRGDAKAGGDIAGGARKKLEKRLGHSVVTKKNFLKKPEDKKRLSK